MLISFITVDSRSDVHPKWVGECLASLQNQDDDNYEIIVVNNIGRKKTIGEAFNEGVKEAQGEWCVFVGDDDYVEGDYISTLRKWMNRIKGNIVSISTYMYAFDDNSGSHFPMTRQSTGAWRREYLLKYPFNEILKKGIDREYIEEVQKRNDLILILKYYHGYYYRRHQDYRCAGDVIFHKEATDFYFVTSNRAFLNQITDRLDSFFVDNDFNYDLAKQAKVTWVEWGNEKAIEISKADLPGKKILRVHAYEVFTNYAHQINWQGFDTIIFVNDYIKEYAEKQFGKMLHAIVIPNGIDIKRFTFKDKPKNNKIAFAGYLTRKKGIGELLFIAKSLPDYEFHLAGRFQENDIAEWFKRKKPDNVFLTEWKYDEAMNEFYQDKSFILNTSLRESQGVSIMEAMSCGLKPLVYDWIGADQIYKNYIYKNFDELKALLEGDYSPSEYRKLIAQYDVDLMYSKIREACFEHVTS